jgi:EAL domain-containing protein (putative c-di-GMP-specific phosphodiesterase class I)
VQQAILESGIDPALLEMEINERVVLNFVEIAEPITELAAMGIRFAVDDFGTGYSSLQLLNRLPTSTHEIDRSFIQPWSESKNFVRFFPGTDRLGLGEGDNDATGNDQKAAKQNHR